MPGSTVPFGLPYPLPGDPADVPQAIQDLAEATEALYLSQSASVTAAQAPGCCSLLGTTQSIPNTTLTLLQFNTVVLDNDSLSNITVDPTSINLRDTRRYFVQATCTWAASTASFRRLEIIVAGTLVVSQQIQPSQAAGFVTTNRTGLVLNGGIGQTVQVQAQQSTGGSLSVQSCALTAWQFDD